MTGRSKLIGAISTIGTIAGALAIFQFVPSCHSSYIDASNKASILWNAADSIDHFMQDVHTLLGDVENRESLQDQIEEQQAQIDSLEHVLDLTLEGKYPYNDSLWVWDAEDQRHELKHITQAQ